MESQGNSFFTQILRKNPKKISSAAGFFPRYARKFPFVYYISAYIVPLLIKTVILFQSYILFASCTPVIDIMKI